MIDVEPIFKGKGHYLGTCHQWVGEEPPPGHLPGWSAASECWWVKLHEVGPYRHRWIIAGFDRDAVRLAAVACLASLEPKIVATWYRSLLPTGVVWCETSDPEECAQRSAGLNCAFEAFDVVEQRTPWREWVPDAAE